MEKLFAYAILYSVGYDFWQKYESELDSLFVNHPDCNELLTLEGKEPKESILLTLSMMKDYPFNHDTFGKMLMAEIKPIYNNSNINDFGYRMYRVWQTLHGVIEYGKEPFFTFNYADDSLTWGDEKKCRDLYETALSYYDESK